MRKLSVIVPVYNEVKTVRTLLETVLAVDLQPQGFGLEIVVVDDGSRDGTREVLAELEAAAIPGLAIYLHEHNRGKGAALQTGFAVASGDYVVVQDADLEYDPHQFTLLLEPVVKRDADVVYGSRFLSTETKRVLYFWHYMGNRFLTLLSNMFTNLNLSDMETCYKLMRRSLLDGIVLRESRFGIEPELTAKLARIPEVRIYEVGISYAGRTYAEGKKINWKDGFRALYCILKYNTWSRK